MRRTVTGQRWRLPEPDLRSQPAPDAASHADTQSAPYAAPDLCAQPEPDAQALGRADAATNAHALVSQKDAAADPSAIAAPYT